MLVKGLILLNAFSHTRGFYLVLENPQIMVSKSVIPPAKKKRMIIKQGSLLCT